MIYCTVIKRTKSWLQVTNTKNFVKFGQVVLEICEWTHRRTDRHRVMLTAKLQPPIGGKVIIGA